MRKFVLISLLSFMILYMRAQGVNILVSPENPQKMHVGTLPLNSNDGSKFEKIRIEVMGGGWTSEFVGTTTYSIGTRQKYLITKEIHGGNSGRHSLKVYNNGKSLDIIIESSEWTAFWISSWHLGYDKNMTPFNITSYDTNGKTDVTDQFTMQTLITTTSLGYVGIGTDDPKSTLDVRGAIIADAVEIKVNKGADFVFSSGYELKPLLEIETFVKENQHLPDIPSEKDMIQNGVNINELQIKLLQKIEELTLYIIEQNKEIKYLKKELKELKDEYSSQ